MEPTWASADGSVRLYLADCLDVLPTLSGVDAVVDLSSHSTTALRTIPPAGGTHAAGRQQQTEDGSRGTLGVSASGTVVAIQSPAVVAAESCGLLRSDAGWNSEGNESAWDSATTEGQLRCEEWSIQDGKSEPPLSRDGSERQVPSLRRNERSGHTPQERRPLRQSLGESGSSLQFLPHERDKAEVVGSQEGWPEASKEQWSCRLVAITDPPYGIALANHAAGKERSDTDWTIAGDNSQEVGHKALETIESWGIPCLAFSSPMKPWRGKWRQHLVWEKGEHVSGGGDPFVCWKPSWELIQVARNARLNGGRDGAVLRFQANKDDYRFHPTPKPVELMEYLVFKASQPGETILDPFMGGGTTGVACVRLGRRFIGIEKEEKYFRIAQRRIQEAMGQEVSVNGVVQKRMFTEEM